jgi:hypothetical protein
MTAALTPELAVDYLRELSADVRAAVILTPAGEPLAGAEELIGAAARLLAAAPEAAEIEVATTGGAVHAARSAEHAVVAVCGRFALPALIRYDLKVVLGELARTPAGPPADAGNEPRADAPGEQPRAA